jgi:carboxypeptidase Taq
MTATAQAYSELIETLYGISLLGSTGAVLGWDERTNLPRKAAKYRADQLSLLAKLCHERFTHPRVGDLLNILEESPLVADPFSETAVNIRQTRRNHTRATKLPIALVEELSRTASLGESAWMEARKNADFQQFSPWLEKTLHLKRQEAACLGYAGSLYDALLDEYEPGETAAGINAIFAELRPHLVEIIGKIAGSRRVAPTHLLTGNFPQNLQETLAATAAEAIGFDFNAGRLDISAHPFCTELGPFDTRMTTRYDDGDFTGAFFGVLHEAGHALYNQGLPPDHWGTPRGSAISLGIHESQSRLWENLVGRSRAFWTFFLPTAKKTFRCLEPVGADDFVFAINDVRPSLIRTESDEATYNLHIMLRFDLEQALLGGDLSVKDLPAAWNARMKSDLGVTPPDEAQGCLQDIHWAGGAIGYFPTYTLGNLYAGQFFEQARKDLGDLDAMFAVGNFAPLLRWLRENIHSTGQTYTARQLLKKVTGEDLKSTPLLNHLRKKAAEFYGV